MVLLVATMMARSTQFCSSRILPGQWYRAIACRALGLICPTILSLTVLYTTLWSLSRISATTSMPMASAISVLSRSWRTALLEDGGWVYCRNNLAARALSARVSLISSLTILVDSCSQTRTLLSKICDRVVAASSAAIMVGITLTSQNASTSLRCTVQRDTLKGWGWRDGSGVLGINDLWVQPQGRINSVY